MGLIEVVLVVAGAAVGAGYLVSVSELFQDSQARWSRAADVLDAELHGELDSWVAGWEAEPGVARPPWGMVAVDMVVLPDPGVPLTADRRRMLKGRWFRHALLRCNVCVGWHAAWLVLVCWSLTAFSAGGVPPVSVGEAAPVWLAAGAVHTVVSKRWL